MNSYASAQSWQSPNMAYQWDYAQQQSPKAMVNHYNDLLQRAADFYATLDTSFDSMPSSGSSDRSYSSTLERRGSTSTNVVAQVKNSIPDKIERRREQNRSSQRAYRERKEKHQRELEQQIAGWQQKNLLLSRSYSHQSSEVKRLKRQIEQLSGEITALQRGLPNLCGSISQSPAEFDLVPFFDGGSFSPTSPRMHNSFSRTR